MGAQQDSSILLESGDSLLCNLCDFFAAFFHVGVQAGTDEGKTQSVHAQWCMDSYSDEQNPLELLPRRACQVFLASVCLHASLSVSPCARVSVVLNGISVSQQ